MQFINFFPLTIFLLLKITFSAELPNDISTIETANDFINTQNERINILAVYPEIAASLAVLVNKTRNIQKKYKFIRKNKLKSRNKNLLLILKVLSNEISFITNESDRNDVLEFLNHSIEQIDNFINITNYRGLQNDASILQEIIEKVISEFEDIDIFLSNFKELKPNLFRIIFSKYKLHLFKGRIKKIKEKFIGYMNFRMENSIKLKFKKIQELIKLKEIFHKIYDEMILMPDEQIETFVMSFKEDLLEVNSKLYVKLFHFYEKDNQFLRDIIKWLDEMN